VTGIRIIPLGGLGEVGKNMTLYETEGGSVLVDAGLAFPRDEHLGVDLVLPDFSYLKDHAADIRAVLLTHAHEDHVGSLPYVLREVAVPRVLATKLTLGLVQSKLDEHGLLSKVQLEEIQPEGGPIDVGPFRVDFVRMAHSVPDNVAFVLEAQGLRVLHTSDYKLDHTPVDGFKTDVGKLAALGNAGIDLMLGDSTNAERPGYTGSERLVGEAFRQIIPLRKGRVLIATFASNVHRMQQAIDVALESDRKVCVVGRSMRKNLNIARSLGYLSVGEDTLIRPAELDDYPPDKVLVLCTGSQGEPLSALTRIAYNDHSAVRVDRGDTVIISAKPGERAACARHD
jgi:ribonuclease J